MVDEVVDPVELLREELDELHERLAALTARMADLERDRDALYAEAEAQGDRMERSEARLRRARLSLRRAVARAAATRRGDAAGANGPIDPWEGYDEVVRKALAKFGLASADRVADATDRGGRPPASLRDPDPEWRQAAIDGVAVLESRLDAEKLLAGPLDDGQKARVDQIAREMIDALTPVAGGREPIN
jgi:FtsZ-binding cell division protein ZapB